MNDPASLRPILVDAYGVFSVQTPYVSGGTEAEVRQGKNVAEAAKAAGIQHFVYGSAGIGKKGTGIPSWESKLQIEEHLHALDLPLTILRPMAFMELMTDKKFYPALTTWHVMPTLMGAGRRVPWLSTDDLGAIVAKVFADPGHHIGRDLKLASDVQSIDECRVIYSVVTGKNPARLPMPPGIFERFGLIGQDLSAMWRWLRTGETDVDAEGTLAIHPGALSVEAWLRTRRV